MALSRREFVRKIGAGSAGVAAASHLIGYGHEELLAFDFQAQGARQGRPAMGGPAPIRLDELIEVSRLSIQLADRQHDAA